MVSFIGAESAGRLGSGGVTCTVPPGAQEGDVLIAFATVLYNAVEAPAGWSVLQSSSGNTSLIAATRVAESGSGSYEFTHGGYASAIVAILAFRDADFGGVVSALAQSLTAPSLSETSPGQGMLVCASALGGGFEIDVDWSAPPGMTKRVDADGGSMVDASLCAATLSAPPSPTEPRTFSPSGGTASSLPEQSVSVWLPGIGPSATPATVTAPPVTLTISTPAGSVTAGTVIPASVTAPPVAVSVNTPAGTVTAATVIPASVTAPPIALAVSVPVGNVTTGTVAPASVTAGPVAVALFTPAGSVSVATVIGASVTAPPVQLRLSTPAGGVTAGSIIPAAVSAPAVAITISTPGGTVVALTGTRLAELILSGTAEVRRGISGTAEVETLTGTAEVRTLSGTAEIQPGLSGAVAG